MVLACEMSNPGGGGVEDDMIFIARTVILWCIFVDSCFCVAILASVFYCFCFSALRDTCSFSGKAAFSLF